MWSLPTWLTLAGFLTIAGWVWAFIRRPRIKLSAGPGAPWCVQTRMQLVGPVGPVAQAFDGLANYYRIRATNSGMTLAKGCHVSLTRLWYVENNTWRRLGTWQPVDLIWSGKAGVQKIDLSSGEEVFCDVGHVSSNYIQSNVETATRVMRRAGPLPAEHGRFVLDLATVFNAQPNALEEGAYAIEVAVYSDNARTQTLVCNLWYPGAYALITDTHMDRSLGRTVLEQRDRPPEEGTPYAAPAVTP